MSSDNNPVMVSFLETEAISAGDKDTEIKQLANVADMKSIEVDSLTNSADPEAKRQVPGRKISRQQELTI
jgi:soluble P-type ATPase